MSELSKSKVDGLKYSLGSMSIGIKFTELMYLFISSIRSVIKGREKIFWKNQCPKELLPRTVFSDN